MNIEKEIKLRLSLLDDDDDEVRNYVKKSIIKLGLKTIPYLEKFFFEIHNEKLLQDIEQIITEIKFKEIEKLLLKWYKTDNKDLIFALWIISLINDFYIEWKIINDSVNQIVKDTWLKFKNNYTPIQKIETLNYTMFKEKKFETKIKSDNIKLPFSYFLPNLLKTKEGNPFSMVPFYIAVAQRLKLNIFGVLLPNFPIACLVSEEFLYENNFENLHEYVIFYIDVNNKGNFISKNDLSYVLNHYKLNDIQNFLNPVSNRTLLMHYIYKVINIFLYNNIIEKANFFKKLIKKINSTCNF